MIEVSFQCLEDHASLWDEILEGLGEGEIGHRFQDRMDSFGENVATCLEDILEDEAFGTEAFYLEAWERNGLNVWMSFPFPDSCFVDELRKLFRLCPVSGVKVLVVDE